jgi:signal transduction histidine kinase
VGAHAYDVDEELEARVAADQLQLVYGPGPLPSFTPFACASLYAVVAWPAVAHRRLVIWLVAIAILFVVRVTLRQLYHRRPRRSTVETARWRRAIVLFGLVNGTTWGVGAWLVLPASVLGNHMLFVVLSAGLTAGASAYNAGYLPSFFTYSLFLTAPLALRMLTISDEVHRVLGILLVLFWAAMAVLARSTANALRQAAWLRYSVARLNEVLELRVVERTAQLRQALAARDEFIMVASHELKTPLTSLGFHLELLAGELGDKLPPASLQRVLRLSRLMSRLTALVRTLLDVSSITDGKLKLELRQCDLAEVVRRAVMDLEDDLLGKGCTLSLAIEGPIWGQWDPVRIEQILINLLSNAMKYAAGHPVAVVLRSDGESAQLIVEDEGPGIAAGDLARIFEKYERASSAYNYGGLGLGLFVTRQLIEAIGGEIHAHSTLGSGTRFTVLLPRKPESSQA